VQRDKLVVRFKSDHTDDAPDRADDHSSLTIAWHKPPSKDRAGSCSRTMHLEATSARNSSSAGRAWSAPSREAAGG
jgi:hypothetical protein